MSKILSLVGWSVVLGILMGCSKREAPAPTDFVMFDADTACAIIVSEKATEHELRAAKLLQQTLAKAARRPRDDFAIVHRPPTEGTAIVVKGQTEATGSKLEEKVAYRVSPERLEISAYPADAIEAAAAWFLEQVVGARWFMPRALGEHVPRREELRLPFGETEHRPSYISRNLSVGGGEGGRAWWRLNRQRAWFNHHHAMNALFKPEDLRAKPELQALFYGRRTVPAAGDGNWQPNIASISAAVHAAQVLRERKEFSSAIGMNDSIRYDQSEETKRLLGEPRWFRLRPDFSPLVFRFVNEVAKRVPDRYLGAYAYDWTEDTPPFPVEKNVVPYLTADRSEWFNPHFAEEDKALIARWVASGAEVVGLYDYYYGAPFLVPRPTLYAVNRSIPFAREAGAKAFYAETYSNWALDGPKAWLAAQLLWDSTQDPESLLDIYYREFWREAAEPMRAFYALCDEQWLNQPPPSYWIKYYKDDHQYLLFPADVRQRLRGFLEQAMASATTELTRNRLRFVSAGFSVTEAFCSFNETRDRLSRAAHKPVVNPEELTQLQVEYTEQLDVLRTVTATVKTEHPLAIQSELIEEYTRNDPRRRAEWRIGSRAKDKPETGDLKPEDRSRASGEEGKRAGAKAEDSRLGDELLLDPGLDQVRVEPTSGFFDIHWAKKEPWRGYGEPYQTREVRILKSDSGLRSQASGLLFSGCKQETFSQVVRATAGKTYVARVKMHGKVSPGNMTFLIINFQDAQGRPLGFGLIDRVPVGTFNEPIELLTWMEAPKEAAWVGLGVRALNQVDDDHAVFSDFSLREVR